LVLAEVAAPPDVFDDIEADVATQERPQPCARARDGSSCRRW